MKAGADLGEYSPRSNRKNRNQSQTIPASQRARANTKPRNREKGHHSPNRSHLTGAVSPPGSSLMPESTFYSTNQSYLEQIRTKASESKNQSPISVQPKTNLMGRNRKDSESREYAMPKNKFIKRMDT